jgi:WD40 repeat protein
VLHKKAPGKHRSSSSNISGVTTARYLNDFIISSAGASDGLIKFWDVRGSLKKPFQLYNPNIGEKRIYGINSIDFDIRRNLLYCSLLSSKIFALDITRLDVVDTYQHNMFDNNSFYCGISLSPCGEYIAGGSKSSDIFVWSTSDRRLFTLQGHRSDVNCVSWSRHDFQLLSCSDDTTVRTWEVHAIPKDPTAEPLVGFAQEVTLPPLPASASTVSSEDTENKTINSLPPTNQSECRMNQSESSNPNARLAEAKPELRHPAKKRKITDYFRPINRDR